MVLGGAFTFTIGALGGRKRRAYRQRRRPRGNPFCQLSGSVELVSWLDDLLHEANSQGFGGVEFVARQQPASAASKSSIPSVIHQP